MLRDIIVVGASAGGVTALKDLVKCLPKDLKGSVFIVLHISPYAESRLPWILNQAGPLQAIHPKDGQEIESGKIYVATADHHMILEEGRILVKKGPKENRFRPSIDALFRSAAYVYGSRVIGIILSGMLNDGASGLWAIKQAGGLAIIQSLDDAEQPQLPENVMEYVEADYKLNAADMGLIISSLVNEQAPERNKYSNEELKKLKMEVVIATRDNAFEMGIMDMGTLTPFTCPECHGALVRLADGKIIRFRCHTGHAYTASSLLAEVTESVETTLWQSMRAMEEMNMLLKNIAEQYLKIDNPKAAGLFQQKAKEAAERARLIHDSVFRQQLFIEDLRLNLEPDSPLTSP